MTGGQLGCSVNTGCSTQWLKPERFKVAMMSLWGYIKWLRKWWITTKLINPIIFFSMKLFSVLLPSPLWHRYAMTSMFMCTYRHQYHYNKICPCYDYLVNSKCNGIGGGASYAEVCINHAVSLQKLFLIYYSCSCSFTSMGRNLKYPLIHFLQVSSGSSKITILFWVRFFPILGPWQSTNLFQLRIPFNARWSLNTLICHFLHIKCIYKEYITAEL